MANLCPRCGQFAPPHSYNEFQPYCPTCGWYFAERPLATVVPVMVITPAKVYRAKKPNGTNERIVTDPGSYRVKLDDIRVTILNSLRFVPSCDLQICSVLTEDNILFQLRE